jgi:hypothetical protein
MTGEQVFSKFIRFSYFYITAPSEVWDSPEQAAHHIFRLYVGTLSVIQYVAGFRVRKFLF